MTAHAFDTSLASSPDARRTQLDAAAITARMDRLPATAYLWRLIVLISLGGFFEVYDLIFTGYVAPGMAKSGVLATTTETFFGLHGIAGFIAATFAGLFVGTFFLGFLPDRYGRKKVFTYSLVWYCVGSAIMALQTDGTSMVLWRFLTGIGIGVEIVTIDSYITELVPQSMRGRAMAFNQAIMFGAAPVAALLSYWLMPLSPLGIEGWRWVILIGCMGAVLVWFIRRGIPESPRWLALKGHTQAADRILRAMETRVAAQYGRPLPAPGAINLPERPPTSTFAQLWQPPYRSRMLMLLAFNFFQAVGYYGFANWVPTLLIGQGITVTKSLLYSFVIAFALPAGPLLAMTIADRVQRKWLIVIPALCVVVFGLAFARMKDPFWLIVFGVLISLCGQVISASYHTYQSELFPTGVRCRANGFVYSASRLGAMLSGFLIAFLLRHFGVTGVFAGITTCMLVVALSIGLFGPRVNGLSIEQLSH